MSERLEEIKERWRYLLPEAENCAEHVQDIAWLISALADSQAQVAQLRSALEFYGMRDNWQRMAEDHPIEDTLVAYDADEELTCGKRARAALSASPEPRLLGELYALRRVYRIASELNGKRCRMSPEQENEVHERLFQALKAVDALAGCNGGSGNKTEPALLAELRALRELENVAGKLTRLVGYTLGVPGLSDAARIARGTETEAVRAIAELHDALAAVVRAREGK